MKQVRCGVFETNSSSTHSLTICTLEEFEKWKRGELLFNYWNDCFEKSVELSEQQKQSAQAHYNDTKETYWKDWEQLSDVEMKSWYTKYYNTYLRYNNHDNLQTYDQWLKDYDLERYEQSYTSPSGDKLVAFGKYGYN